MGSFGKTALLLAGTALALGNAPAEVPKPASPATLEAQRTAAATLPAEDGRDAAFAAQGFIATRADPLIKAADGRVEKWCKEVIICKEFYICCGRSF